jgi:predicted nucleotidyltransferase
MNNIINNILDNIKNQLNITDEKILSIYLYGSRVYGTATEKSDYDFIVVVDSEKSFLDAIEIQGNHISIYNKAKFQELIDQHEISALECLFLDKQFIIKENWKPIFVLNLSQLRKSFSAKSSNSFVKAKKKMMYGEEYIAKKSLWHSFRIIYFGIQLATTGKITNYSEANHLYNNIVFNPSNDAEYYKQTFLKSHNELMTKFRLVAPK